MEEMKKIFVTVVQGGEIKRFQFLYIGLLQGGGSLWNIGTLRADFDLKLFWAASAWPLGLFRLAFLPTCLVFYFVSGVIISIILGGEDAPTKTFHTEWQTSSINFCWRQPLPVSGLWIRVECVSMAALSVCTPWTLSTALYSMVSREHRSFLQVLSHVGKEF